MALCGCAADTPAPRPARFELVVLGTAQDGGLPHVGCTKPCCTQARRTGRTLSPACLGIRDTVSGQRLLVEATPAIESQLARWGLPVRAEPNPVDAVLLTHAHIGHYLGLAHFGREVAATHGVAVHATPRLCEFLRGNGPWGQLVQLGQIVPVSHAPGETFIPLPGLTVTALRVPHRDEYSDTVAWRIRGEHKTVLFVPDVDAWSKSPGLLESLVDGVDLAFLDGTFWDGSELPGRDLREIPHPPITDTMERLAERARARPGVFRFLHLNHTNPLLHDPALVHRLEAAGFALAREGEVHEL